MESFQAFMHNSRMSLPARLDPARQLWMNSEGVLRIFAAITQSGGKLRFVGGCVRDALLGKCVGDVDLACDLPPEKSVEIFKAANIKVSPTGIEHGTITAIADHKGYEITTLRRDVETDGRHAKVEFTGDWQADAARRDFTMNALYADPDGTVHDYFNGRDDLAKGLVRFIGSPEDRIKEDVLRILRFFRFHAWFGQGPADAAGLKACRDLAPSLPQLSVERVWREIAKLLAADNPAPAWRLMIDHQILPHILPEATNITRLENLLISEKKFENPTSNLARFAALLPQDAEAAGKIAQKLKLSNRETAHLQALATLPANLRGKLDPIPFRRMLYEYGPELCREAALLLAAEDRAADLEPALTTAAAWEKPVFPLKGEDLLKIGLAPGPKVGETLRALEEWWASRDFRPSRQECVAAISSLEIP